MAKQPPVAIDPKMLAYFLAPCVSPKHLKDWVYFFLDIDLPLGCVDPESNSSPVEAIYDAYAAYRDDTCLEKSGYIWMASRDSFKTLSGATLNLLLVVHFKSQIAHMAAVRKQAEKNIEYTNTFLRKIEPYLIAAGRKIISDSKNKIQIVNEDQSISFVDIVVANLAGGNSQHVPAASWDEIDTLSKQGLVGYKESQLVPTRMGGKGPLTIKYSTRKFAFGIFEQEIQNIHKTGEELQKWNIIDVTEKCPPSRHLPEKPKQLRYVRTSLPQQNISKEEYDLTDAKEKTNFEPIEAYAGCAKCPLLQNCKMRLAHRPETDVGGLYRDIDFTIRQFRTVSDDMAEAQLLCEKPSLSGLVYPRFSETGNTYTTQEAMRVLTGDANAPDLGIEGLIQQIKALGVSIYVGGDWGHSGAQAFVVTAVMPNGEWWILDTYSVPDLEFDEIKEMGMSIRDKYGPKKWFMDTNAPMFIKTFNKNGMYCAEFDKDIQGGIEAVRTQICTASGKRKMKVIKHPKNEFFLQMLRKHHYKLDSAGEPTDQPDDGPESHVGDSIRYLGQNLFGSKGAKPVIATQIEKQTTARPTSAMDNDLNRQIFKSVIKDSIQTPNNQDAAGSGKKKIYW